MNAPFPILKDDEREHPVPFLWRSKLRDIAEALKDGNFNLLGLADVEPQDDDAAAAVARNIKGYGFTLTSLPDESWETSVCQWQIEYWEVMVDLFTVEEGYSDLVLHVHVFERDGGFNFKVHYVYVP
ncbi:hypothetical protein IP65_01575 [Novosphingobium sp. AAP1]|uniref:DUF7668 domain-containing protein n=1 Tax=Novosphingobium sp. AAP1 TaxID=1523413 RepID=UPI0006CD7905|nr:hypothetical protein [Novosphingobium sp. AAP1]KPF56514.1 hypothetical protein IP65_01575 [Novosphingobium sp. AAP1]